MEGTILVTPEQLKSTANEFNSIMTQVQSLTNSMTDQVHGLNSKFRGDAATAYTQKFNQLNDDIARLTGKINKHVTNLNELADKFSVVERTNADLSNSLAGDVLP